MQHYLLDGRLAKPLPAGQYSFSVISEIELLSFPDLTTVDEQKIGELLALLDRVELTQAVRLEAIKLRKQTRLKLPDAIIAATALCTGIELLTMDQYLLAVMRSVDKPK